MTVDNFKALVPVWAAQDEPTPPPRRTPPRFDQKDWFHDFKIKNGITLILIFAWAASMMLGCCVTGVIVRHNTTERVTAEVTSQLRQDFQKYLDQMDQEQKASQFLSGEASKQAAIEDLTYKIDNLIATYRQDLGVTEEGAYSVGWCVIARLVTGGWFGNTIDEVLNKPGQWEGNFKDHAVRNEDTAIARKIATDFYNGLYPDGFTDDLVYMNREANGRVTLRNEYLTGPDTVYWRYAK